MAVDEDLAERVRAVLAGNGQLRKVRMFGGLCFMLNGNMVAGTSKRGLLVRVGKEQHARALARPDARPMEMSGRIMGGYVVVPRHESGNAQQEEAQFRFAGDSPLEGDGFELPVRGREQSGCRPFWVGALRSGAVRARCF